jgi:hypothetical protein
MGVLEYGLMNTVGCGAVPRTGVVSALLKQFFQFGNTRVQLRESKGHVASRKKLSDL